MFLTFLIISSNNVFAWWNTSWKYRIKINITENSGSSLANYQVNITLTSNNFNGWSYLNKNCSDIRFIDSDDTTELSYWIKKCDVDQNEIIVWVKIPSISASSSKIIYMYYNNTNAISESNFTSTFIQPPIKSYSVYSTPTASGANYFNDIDCYKDYCVVVGSDHATTNGDYQWRIEKRYYINGSIIWTKQENVYDYGSSGVTDEDATGVIIDSSENIIVVGWYLNKTNDKYYWRVEKRDSSGNLIWSKNTEEDNCSASPYDVAIDESGNIIIVGRGSDFSYDSYAGDFICDGYWRVEKRDSSGNLIWSKGWDHSQYDDSIYSVDINGTYIYICGGIYGDGDGLVYKLDSSGNVIWYRNPGGASGDEYCRGIIYDDGYVAIAGKVNGYEYVRKYKDNGDTVSYLWTKYYESASYGFWKIIEDIDGNYVVIRKLNNTLLKVSNTSGDVIWGSEYASHDLESIDIIDYNYMVTGEGVTDPNNIYMSRFKSRNIVSPEPSFSVVSYTPNIVYSLPPSSPTYEYNKEYNFISRICDFDNDLPYYNDISNVLFEFKNVNNTVTNYVIYNSTCSDYNITITNIEAGTHSLIWYVNDSYNKWDSYSDSFTINKATPTINIFIDGQSSNKTITWMESVNIKINETNLGDDDLTYCLYQNNTQLGCGTEYSTTFQSGNGTYLFFANSTTGQNYTSGQSSYLYLFINKAWNQTNNMLIGVEYKYDIDKLGIPLPYKNGSRIQDNLNQTIAGSYTYCVIPVNVTNNGTAYGVDPTTFTNINVSIECPSGWNCSYPIISSLESGATAYVNVSTIGYNKITRVLSTHSIINETVIVDEYVVATYNVSGENNDTISYSNVKIIGSIPYPSVYYNITPYIFYDDLSPSETYIFNINITGIPVRETSWIIQPTYFSNVTLYEYNATLTVYDGNVSSHEITYLIPKSRLTGWSNRQSNTEVFVIDGKTTGFAVTETNTTINITIFTNFSSSSLDEGEHYVYISYKVPYTPPSPSAGGGGGGWITPRLYYSPEKLFIPIYLPEKCNSTMVNITWVSDEDVQATIVISGDIKNITVQPKDGSRILLKKNTQIVLPVKICVTNLYQGPIMIKGYSGTIELMITMKTGGIFRAKLPVEVRIYKHVTPPAPPKPVAEEKIVKIVKIVLGMVFIYLIFKILT